MITEKQMPTRIGDKWIQKIYTYADSGGHPLQEEVLELSQEEALRLIPLNTVEVISVNLLSFIVSLPFNLQDELATYTQNNKLLEVIFNSGKISKEDIVKLKERILYDYSKQAFSEELKNTMIAALNNLDN